MTRNLKNQVPLDVTMAPGAQLLLLPSFYGFAAWSAALGIYIISPYEQHFSPETWSLIAYTLFVFATSMILFSFLAQDSMKISEIKINPKSDWLWFFIAVLIGGFGLYLYIRDLSLYFGGFSGFIEILTQSSLDVRGAAQEVAGLGFQVSYLSWIAIFFGLILGLQAKLLAWQRLLLLTTALILFAINLAFIDRTRPIWILVVCLMGFIVSRKSQNIRPIRAISSVVGIPLAIFFLFALISGKFDASAGLFDNFIIYVTGGLGYLDSLVADVASAPFTAAETFLPITKFLKSIGVLDFAPSEVLDFRMVPFATNVGTFLQPLFADGGWLLLMLGLPILVLGTDWLALACFRTQTLMGRFFWANLTFTMLISFFVPKYNNTAIYVFGGVLLVDQARRVAAGGLNKKDNRSLNK